MKKLVLLVAVIASVSLFSCTGNEGSKSGSDSAAASAASQPQAEASVPAENPSAPVVEENKTSKPAEEPAK